MICNKCKHDDVGVIIQRLQACLTRHLKLPEPDDIAEANRKIGAEAELESVIEWLENGKKKKCG